MNAAGEVYEDVWIKYLRLGAQSWKQVTFYNASSDQLIPRPFQFKISGTVHSVSWGWEVKYMTEDAEEAVKV